MDVGDVQDADLVTAPERVRLDGRVRARGTRHDPAELVAEVPDALDRALDGTEELWHQPERARVGRSLERRRVEADRREPDGEDDRDEPRDRGSKDLEPSVPEREEPEGSRAGDTHQDHPSGEPSGRGERVPLDLGGDGVHSSAEPLLQLLDVDLAQRRTEVKRCAVGVGPEPPSGGSEMSVTLRPKSASSWTWNGPASTVVFANAWSASAAPATPTRIGPRSLAQRGMRSHAGHRSSGLGGFATIVVLTMGLFSSEDDRGSSSERAWAESA